MRLPVALILASSAAAAALATTVALAQGVSPPARKAGWWEITMNMAGLGTQKMGQCVDATTEKANNAFANNMQRGHCGAGAAIHPVPGGWAFSSQCKEGKMTMTSNGLVKGDFNSGYHMESTTRMDPAPTPQFAETKMTMDAKWTGPCPAGKKPGDMTMNGMNMHMPAGRAPG